MPKENKVSRALRKISRSVANGLIFPDTRNWKVVALCLAGAIIFWFFNSLGKEYTTRIKYPISFLYSLEGTQVVGELPTSILLNVTGGGWNLLKHNLNGRRSEAITLFLENPTSTKYFARTDLRAFASEAVKDFSLNFVLTDTLSFDIQPVTSKRVVLALDSSQLQFETNHLQSSPTQIYPDTLTLTGPASMIEATPDTLWIPVPDRELDDDFQDKIDVDFLPSEYLKPSVSEFTLAISVTEFSEVTRYVPLQRIGFPSDSSIYVSDSVLRVVFWLPTEQASSIDTLSLSSRIYADSLQDSDSLWIPLIDYTWLPADDYAVIPQWIRIFRRNE